MNARAIATVFVCLAVVFAGCAGMNDGTGGDSADDGAAGDTTTTLPDTPTASGDDGTTTQSATAEDEPMATTQPTTTHVTTSAGEPTTGSETTTTDTTAGSGGEDSASVSNPFTEGEYYRITAKMGSPSHTFETTFEWRVLSVDGEQVTIKVTNPKTGKSTTAQSNWKKVFSNLNTDSIFPRSVISINLIYPFLRGSALAAQVHSVTVTGTDTVAGVKCKKIKFSGIDMGASRKEAEITACVNKDVPFALHAAVSLSGKTSLTITVEEYRSGEGQ